MNHTTINTKVRLVNLCDENGWAYDTLKNGEIVIYTGLVFDDDSATGLAVWEPF